MTLGARDGQPSSTSYKAKVPRRIDHILVNQQAIQHIVDSAVIEDADSHPHMPIYCYLGAHTPGHRRCVDLPQPLRQEQCLDKVRSQQWLQTEASRWDHLLNMDIQANGHNSLILTFSRKWESYIRYGMDAPFTEGPKIEKIQDLEIFKRD